MLLYLSMSNISFDYSNTDILVTGGTSGIGKAIAEAYLASGANVTITGTKSSKEDYQNIPKELSYIKLNLEDKENIDIIKNLKALKGYNEILIEEFIPGREIQVAIMDNKILGAIELEPKRKFYDYEAKYNSSAKTKHLIPVDLNKNNLAKVTSIAREAHKIIGCKGVTRSDFKFFNGKSYLLCLLYTSPSPRDLSTSRMPSSA